MVRLMASENTIQAGSKLTAIMNEVGAVTHRLAKAMLTGEHLGEISPRWPEIAQCFQSTRAYDVARGTLDNGDGIGEPNVASFFRRRWRRQNRVQPLLRWPRTVHRRASWGRRLTYETTH
jgi:hypothetical protein